MKVDIDTIKMILSRAADIDDKRKAQIIEDILFEARQTCGETKPPKPKTAFQSRRATACISPAPRAGSSS